MHSSCTDISEKLCFVRSITFGHVYSGEVQPHVIFHVTGAGTQTPVQIPQALAIDPSTPGCSGTSVSDSPAPAFQALLGGTSGTTVGVGCTSTSVSGKSLSYVDTDSGLNFNC